MDASSSESAAPTLRQVYLQGLRAGEIRIQRCAACGTVQRLLRDACTACGSTELAFEASAAAGSVYAVTEVMRAPSKALQARVPYTLVLVDLDDGARVMGNGYTGAVIGDRVRGRVDVRHEVPLIDFEPDPAG